MSDGAHDHPVYANAIKELTAKVEDLLDRVDALEATPPPPPPPPSTTRPFSASSPWNTPISGPVAMNSARTAALRASMARLWLNSTSNSHPIYRAKDTDPLVTFTDTVHRGDPSWPAPTTLQWRMPSNAAPSPGDGHMHIISPDGTKVLETIYARRSTTGWDVSRMHVVDLTGTGLGPMNGTRAYGGSAIAGLITPDDVARGRVDHALALALPNSLLYYSGGRYGYDSRGYGKALGYKGFATEQDYDSPTAYKGVIGMGSKVTLMPNADLSALNEPVQLIAQGIKDYGAYVVDRCGEGDICFYAEPTVPATWITALLGPSWGRAEIMKLMPLLQVD